MSVSIPGYDISEKLYESHHSALYRAGAKSSREPVIVKVLKKEYPSPEELGRFRREYEMTESFADLDGIIRTVALTRTGGSLAMILEDMGGESLARIRASEAGLVLALDDFLALAIKIADILGRLHIRNVMHKDINPANILWNRATGDVRLIDFGIATSLERENPEVRNPNVLEGTLAYVSPEQTGRMNRAVDYRTDLYSLGVTFYELLTGVLPFRAADAMELVHCHMAKNPPSPCLIDPSIPETVSLIVEKLMAKRAEDRYQSAFGLKADLETCLSQLRSNGRIGTFQLGQNDVSDRFQIPQKLYGREQEADLIQGAFERAAAGPAELMLVGGFAGIGKSALVRDVQKTVVGKRGYFITGKIDQFMRSTPYSSLIQALKDMIRQILTESGGRLSYWARKLTSVLGPNGRLITDILPELELIIGKQPPVPELPPSESQNRFNILFQNFVRAFAEPAHPLAVFLDDMQWADLSSIKMLEMILTWPGAAHILFICAFRDNEVDDTHPFAVAVENIRKAGIDVHTVTLLPLSFSSVNDLVRETLKCGEEEAAALSELCLQKTRGNPFFLNQFLITLNHEGLIAFVAPGTDGAEKPEWRWDMDRIREMDITDNVVELMVANIRKLPEKAQKVLTLAACVGNEFDLETLAMVHGKTTEETVDDLWEALKEGLIAPSTYIYKSLKDSDLPKVAYRFLHDRVHQAAYSMTAEDLRDCVHLNIGRRLRTMLKEEQAGEKIFDIVNHLNRGARHMTDPSETESLASLNLAAGKKAAASAAYEPAWDYLERGIALLGKDPWEKRYDLSLALYTEAVEVAFLKADFEAMEHLTDEALSHLRNLLDGTRLYETRIRSSAARNRLKDAVDTAYHILGKLGVRLPRTVGMARAFLEFSRTRTKLLGKSDADLLSLPDMSCETSLAIVRIATSSMSALYLSGYNMVSFVLIMRIINLTLKKGIAHETPLWFTYYSVGLSSFSHFEQSMKYGRLAMAMMERKQARKVEVRVIHGFNSYTRHWLEPLRDTLPALLEAYQKSFETGDVEFSGFSSFVYFYHGFYCGRELTALEKDITAHIGVMRRFGLTTNLHYNLLFRQTFRNFMGLSDDPTRLFSDLYNDEEMIRVHADARDWFGMYFIHLNRLVLRYLFGDLAGAATDVKEARRLIRFVPGSYAFVLYYFYRSLIELSLVTHGQSRAKRKKILSKIRKSQKKLKTWAGFAPMNNLHKYQLVEAELARVEDDPGKAAELYDLAIQAARDHEFLQEEAMACELAARFYIGRGQGEIAAIYLKRSHGCWDQWGAKAKVRDIETKHAGLLKTMAGDESHAQIPSTFTVSATTGTLGQSLDLETVMKSSLAISSEIVLDRLLSILMHSVIENAGAQKGFLLLCHDEGLRVETMISSDKEALPDFSPEWLDRYPDIARSIVHYVERTKTEVVLNDAASDSMFVKDSYVVREKPKSVLCMPIIQQGTLSAVLYLENNRVTGAFTPDRVEVLKILAAQAAISIRNAQLYDKLNREIAERAQSEAKYRNIFDNAVEGIFQTGVDGKLIAANPALARIFGYASVEEGFADLDGFAARIYADPLRRQEFIEVLTENGTVRDFEFEAQHRDGHTLTVSLNANAVRDKDGRIIRMEGMLADVTEKKRLDQMRIAKEAAETATRSKSEFLATMSHEIRTPMNAILGMAELLAETELSAEQRDYVRTFRSSGEILLGVINDILDFSKIEAGRVDLESIPTDLESIAESVIKILAMRAHEKSIEIACSLEKGFMPFRIGDQTRIRQILMNLMGNAIKFTHEGEVVLFIGRDRERPDRVLFHVRDTGIGISKDKLESVFESFSQADSSTTRKYGGTGLGLAITRRLTEIMGGSIWAESEPGKGTSFFCSIPLPETDAIGPEWTLKESLDNTGLILVEPNETLGEIIEVQIRETGATVWVTASLESAAKCFELTVRDGRPPALIVLDLSSMDLHDDNPLTALQQNYPDVMPGVIVLATGGASKERIAEMVPALAGILTKPVKRIDLQRKILSALGRDVGVAETSNAPSSAKPFPHLRVLYAEDIDANRKVVQAFTRGLPLNIVIAENGADALEKYLNGTFDLILMDMEMPVMDGFAAIRAIRDHEHKNGLGQTPIISLTAHAFFEHRQRCLEAGASGFLSKPFRKAELFEVIFGVVDTLDGKQGRSEEPGVPEAPSLDLEEPPKEYTASINEIFRDLIPDLFEETAQELATMQKAMDSGDTETVARLAHGLKGAAGNYELFELGDIFRAVETANEEGRPDDMEKWMAEAARYIRTVNIEFLDEE